MARRQIDNARQCPTGLDNARHVRNVQGSDYPTIARAEFGLNVHLIDGTYELFRHYYALPSARDAEGREVAAVRRRGRLASLA